MGYCFPEGVDPAGVAVLCFEPHAYSEVVLQLSAEESAGQHCLPGAPVAPAVLAVLVELVELVAWRTVAAAGDSAAAHGASVAEDASAYRRAACWDSPALQLIEQRSSLEYQ